MLRAGDRVAGEQARRAPAESLSGAFETHGLRADIHALEATLAGAQGALQTARWEVILGPDPFEWQASR